MKCRLYFLRNDLIFNSSKTQCISIGNRQLISKTPPNTTINFSGNIIYPSKHVKNFGIYLDRYMLFDTHINDFHKKVLGILMYISRVSDNLDKQTTIIITKTFVLSLIEYCIRIWGTTNDTLISTVQKMQNFAVRVAVGGVKIFDHISPFFRELKWLTIKQKHRFDVGTTVYKALRGFYPDWLLSFKSNQVTTNSITRQMHSLYVPGTHTLCGDRRTAVLGAKLWNVPPPSLTQATTLNTFEDRLKEFILTDDV